MFKDSPKDSIVINNHQIGRAFAAFYIFYHQKQNFHWLPSVQKIVDKI